jgi:hypothetical protein
MGDGMSKASYTTDPISLPFLSGDYDRQIEIIRGLAHPQLVVTIEGDSSTEIYQRILDINEELRAYGGLQIPLPERCPLCGK